MIVNRNYVPTISVHRAMMVEKEHIKKLLEDIKSEINDIDSMTFIGSGSGCASDMRSECLAVIDRYIEEVQDDT